MSGEERYFPCASMCLHPLIVYQIPEETEHVAQAAFPKGNLYMRLYEQLGAIYSDPLFADLFPQRGQPAQCPTRLALVLSHAVP